MFTSFGYFEDPADDRKVLQNLLTSLKPGGRLLMDVMSREWVIGHFQDHEWNDLDGTFLLEERSFVEGTSRMKNRWVVVRNGEVREFGFILRMYGAPELVSLVRDVGFTNVRAIANVKGEDYHIDSIRLMVLAEKPKA